MSEYTKGKLEYSIVATNSIDLISQENEFEIVASVTSEEDDLGDLEIANAQELVRRWNAFEKGGSHDALLEACHNLAETMGVDYAIKKLSTMHDDNMAVGASVILAGIQRQAKEAEKVAIAAAKKE